MKNREHIEMKVLIAEDLHWRISRIMLLTIPIQSDEQICLLTMAETS